MLLCVCHTFADVEQSKKEEKTKNGERKNLLHKLNGDP